MDIRTQGAVSVRIAAPPHAVYDLVSDVTRTGEWSPECRRCQWVDGAAGPAIGSRFRGWNRSGFVRWSRLVEVVAADPGREFAFRSGGRGQPALRRRHTGDIKPPGVPAEADEPVAATPDGGGSSANSP